MSGRYEHGAEEFAAGILQSGSSPRKEHIEQLFDLLPHEQPARGLGATACSFGSGAYAKGVGIQGLRKECVTFPESTRLITSFVNACFPDHFFTSVVLFCNAKTDIHIDARNHHSPNAVMGISSFTGREIWVGDGLGAKPKEIKGQLVHGTLHDVSRQPALFDAWKHPHCTEDWQGRRIVLVAFSVKALDRLDPDELSTLRTLGFRPPPGVRKGVKHAVQEQPPLAPRSQPWVFEVFSGKGSLSRAFWREGFQVLSIDASGANATSPTVRLNVADKPGQDIFWDLFSQHKPFAVHIGAPCGTVRMSRGNAGTGPPVLRSKAHPLGLPGLEPTVSAKVRSANAVYRFCYNLVLQCIKHGIQVSLDNPVNSYLWPVLEHFARG